jgi:hypothetical protein
MIKDEHDGTGTVYVIYLYQGSDEEPEHPWTVILPFEFTRMVRRGVF